MSDASRGNSQPTGETVDIDGLPHDDEPTFDLIRSSRTLGCFQIESPGQRELLARLQPGRFEDLIVDISLFRPGPVKSDMVTPYLQRRHGFEDVTYPHPVLAEVLRETNGVVVFHEQVIRVIAVATGCSLDDADYVRRHLDSMVDVERWFVSRAMGNGFTSAQAERLWREVFAFASFGFCKSHAAAFALPTYVSAYLKAHHGAFFLAGVLTHDPGMYPRRLIVADARAAGIPILPINVNASEATYRVEPLPNGYGIRLALSEVRGISDPEVASIVDGRAEGAYRSLEDLWRRTDLSRPVLEHLIRVGALDEIEARSGRELLWRVVDLAAEPKPQPGDQLQLTLEESVTASLPDLPLFDSLEVTEAELEVSGIDARRHVMDHYGWLFDEVGCVTASKLASCKNRTQVWVAGVKVASQTPAIRSGQRIIFVTLDDPTGPIDVTVFERVQDRCARTVFHSWLLLVRGELRKRGGASFTHRTDPHAVGITIVVEEAFDLTEVATDRREGLGLEAALQRQRDRQAARALAAGGADEAPSRLWHSSGGSSGR